MRFFITGCLGFVGRFLSDFFIQSGHQVTGVDALPGKDRPGDGAYRFIQADTTQPGDWQNQLQGIDVVVNLAGRNIFKRWTPQYKKAIYDSRILTTRHLVEALPAGETVFCCTSAAGYYGNRGEDILTEEARPGYDFLARVCIDWENEANAAQKKGARVAVMRFGIVMGKNGGALTKMIPAYRFFMGGPLGDGRQWFPWIHIHDLAGAILHSVEHSEVEGPVNFCSPEPVRNHEFSSTLAGVLGRPSLVRVPAFILRLAAGELGEALLNSQRVFPEKLLSTGYEFSYPYLEDALRACIQ
jgi:uncharacterized protein